MFTALSIARLCAYIPQYQCRHQHFPYSFVGNCVTYLKPMLNLSRRIRYQHHNRCALKSPIQSFGHVVIRIPHGRAVTSQVRQFLRVSCDQQQFAGGDLAEKVGEDAGCQGTGSREESYFRRHFVDYLVVG